VETLAQHAGVPVWSGLADEFHPTQMLADFLTMIEHRDKPVGQIATCYLGDARFNMGNSLMVMGCKMGMDERIELLKPYQVNMDAVKKTGMSYLPGDSNDGMFGGNSN
jgi:ornithine carbamoyltransferase